MEVDGDKVTFKQGKKTFEAPVKPENTAEKYNTNTIRYLPGDKVQDIGLGGTHTKPVFEGSGADTPGGSR